MLSTLPSRQLNFNGFRVTKVVTPLALGVILLTSVGRKAEARPVIIQPPAPTTQIIGSPIPSPVPVVPGTTYPYSFSPYSNGNFNNHNYNNGGYSYYDNYPGYYGGYNRVITPGRAVIQNSMLINPTVINSRVYDSVLVDPVILNSPGFPRRVYSQPPVIYNPPSIYTSPGFSIQVGY
jgi:hypothetical protein